jgi:hypothetical protein
MCDHDRDEIGPYNMAKRSLMMFHAGLPADERLMLSRAAQALVEHVAPLAECGAVSDLRFF